MDGDQTTNEPHQNKIGSADDATSVAPKRGTTTNYLTIKVARGPLDWLGFVVLALTFLAAAAAAFFSGRLAYLTTNLVHDSAKNLEAGTRAWIVPTGARIDGAVELKTPLRIKVAFENIGKEVALDVIHVWGKSAEFDVPLDAAGTPYIDPAKVNWPRVIECGGNRPGTGRSIYPSGKYEDIRYIFGGGPSQRFLEKRESFWMIGCFAYRTFGKVRQSPYCLYWQPRRDKPIQESSFEFCPIGGGTAN
jgi:hypothetical protein